MKRIALVTDSTADLTEEIKNECNVHVVHLKVRFEDQEYLDEEISSEDFYQRLSEVKILPKSSQPSPEEFSQLYGKLLDDYDEIISIHLSSGLSGTINAACLGKKALTDEFGEKIHIVDSKGISLGIGLMVLEAAKNIKKGLETTGILNKLAVAGKNIETLFTLNTLEYLQKGGRIGKVNSIIGSLLNIKPIIRVGDDGIYHSFGRARSQEKALQSIVRAFHDLSKGRKPINLAVAHGAAEEAGLYLKELMERAFQIPATIFTQVGPVIGVHTGPGTIGAAVHFE